MEEKKVKSEFLAKSEAFGKEMSDLINPEKKDRKAIIVIAVETDENDDTTCAVSLSGSGFELVNGIMSFIKK